MANLETRMPAETWLAWLDEGHFLHFQPESGAVRSWLELLYWRSLSCELDLPRYGLSPRLAPTLAWVDRLPPAEICWWYMADRLGRLAHQAQSPLDAQTVQAIGANLVQAEEAVVQELLQSLVDFYDLPARSASQQQRAWLATGRRLVENFLDWEALGRPGLEVFGPILRVAALELLVPSSGRQ